MYKLFFMDTQYFIKICIGTELYCDQNYGSFFHNLGAFSGKLKGCQVVPHYNPILSIRDTLFSNLVICSRVTVMVVKVAVDLWVIYYYRTDWYLCSSWLILNNTFSNFSSIYKTFILNNLSTISSKCYQLLRLRIQKILYVQEEF